MPNSQSRLIEEHQIAASELASLDGAAQYHFAQGLLAGLAIAVDAHVDGEDPRYAASISQLRDTATDISDQFESSTDEGANTQ